MKGFRFYEELENKGRKSERSKGTVVAVLYGEFWVGDCGDHHDIIFEGVRGVYDAPNSPVCSCGPAFGYLRLMCRRISEARAREIHPALFAYLEG